MFVAAAGRGQAQAREAAAAAHLQWRRRHGLRRTVLEALDLEWAGEEEEEEDFIRIHRIL